MTVNSAETGAKANLNALPDKGHPAPDFTLPDLQGVTHTLSEYRGKVVLLNVWATWCMPCRVEMPAIESLHNKLKGEKFAILAVSIDRSEAGIVKRFVKKNNITFPVLLSPDGMFQGLYMTRSIPMSFIVDKNGIIVSKVPGAREWDSDEAVKIFQDLINK